MAGMPGDLRPAHGHGRTGLASPRVVSARSRRLAHSQRSRAAPAAKSVPHASASRRWVLLPEASDGGCGLNGHANTNGELVAARAQLASLQAGKPADELSLSQSWK
jgi:hypothetical protein